ETLGADPVLRRYRAGVALGGPISRNHTFYYAAVEREGTHDQTASDISSSTATAINRALSAGLLPEIGTRQLTLGPFPTARRETESSVKISHSLEGRGALTGAVAANQNADDHDAFNRFGLSDRSARGSASTRDVAATGSWNRALTARTANELRGQIAARRQTFQTADPQGPGVVVSGVAEFRTSYVGDSDRRQSYFESGDFATYSRGQHLLKVGGGFKRIAVDGTVSDGVLGLYTFRSLDGFLGGHPDLTRRMSGTAEIDFAVSRAHAFVQDHWTLAPGLTVDAGARFDAARLPASLGMTSRHISPRFGLAWAATPKWVVRGGAGIFADRLVLASLERALSSSQLGIVEHIDDGSQASV